MSSNYVFFASGRSGRPRRHGREPVMQHGHPAARDPTVDRSIGVIKRKDSMVAACEHSWQGCRALSAGQLYPAAASHDRNSVNHSLPKTFPHPVIPTFSTRPLQLGSTPPSPEAQAEIGLTLPGHFGPVSALAGRSLHLLPTSDSTKPFGALPNFRPSTASVRARSEKFLSVDKALISNQDRPQEIHESHTFNNSPSACTEAEYSTKSSSGSTCLLFADFRDRPFRVTQATELVAQPYQVAPDSTHNEPSPFEFLLSRIESALLITVCSERGDLPPQDQQPCPFDTFVDQLSFQPHPLSKASDIQLPSSHPNSHLTSKSIKMIDPFRAFGSKDSKEKRKPTPPRALFQNLPAAHSAIVNQSRAEGSKFPSTSLGLTSVHNPSTPLPKSGVGLPSSFDSHHDEPASDELKGQLKRSMSNTQRLGHTRRHSSTSIASSILNPRRSRSVGSSVRIPSPFHENTGQGSTEFGPEDIEMKTLRWRRPDIHGQIEGLHDVEVRNSMSIFGMGNPSRSSLERMAGVTSSQEEQEPGSLEESSTSTLDSIVGRYGNSEEWMRLGEGGRHSVEMSTSHEISSLTAAREDTLSLSAEYEENVEQLNPAPLRIARKDDETGPAPDWPLPALPAGSTANTSGVNQTSEAPSYGLTQELLDLTVQQPGSCHYEDVSWIGHCSSLVPRDISQKELKQLKFAHPASDAEAELDIGAAAGHFSASAARAGGIVRGNVELHGFSNQDIIAHLSLGHPGSDPELESLKARENTSMKTLSQGDDGDWETMHEASFPEKSFMKSTLHNDGLSTSLANISSFESLHTFHKQPVMPWDPLGKTKALVSHPAQVPVPFRGRIKRETVSGEKVIVPEFDLGLKRYDSPSTGFSPYAEEIGSPTRRQTNLSQRPQPLPVTHRNPFSSSPPEAEQRRIERAQGKVAEIADEDDLQAFDDEDDTFDERKRKKDLRSAGKDFQPDSTALAHDWPLEEGDDIIAPSATQETELSKLDSMEGSYADSVESNTAQSTSSILPHPRHLQRSPGTFDKITVVGVKGNITGSPSGRGMRGVGSSEADYSTDSTVMAKIRYEKLQETPTKANAKKAVKFVDTDTMDSEDKPVKTHDGRTISAPKPCKLPNTLPDINSFAPSRRPHEDAPAAEIAAYLNIANDDWVRLKHECPMFPLRPEHFESEYYDEDKGAYTGIKRCRRDRSGILQDDGRVLEWAKCFVHDRWEFSHAPTLLPRRQNLRAAEVELQHKIGRQVVMWGMAVPVLGWSIVWDVSQRGAGTMDMMKQLSHGAVREFHDDEVEMAKRWIWWGMAGAFGLFLGLLVMTIILILE